MPAVRCPGRILVFSFTGQLLRNTIAQIDHPDLEVPVLLLVSYGPAIRRPIRTCPITAHSWLIRREQLNVRSVSIHNINLGLARPARDERDLVPVGAVGRRCIVGASTQRYSSGSRRIEPRKNKVAAVAGALRVENRVAIGLIHRCDVESRSNLTYETRAPSPHIELVYLGPGVAEHREYHRLNGGRPGRRKRPTTRRDCACF